MISIETIEKDIAELEARDTSFATCERLSILYTVRDHLRGYSVSPEAAVKCAQSSDFLKAVNGKSPDKVFRIMDELMDTVAVMHPKIYDAVIEKLKRI